MPSITPSLWFDDDLEEAMRFYAAIFPNSAIEQVSRYTDAGPGTPGQVASASFVLDGNRFTGINGGPLFPFTEAISFLIECADQDEVDHYWYALVDGGQESQCGWLKDRFGVSWQIVPRRLIELQMLGGPGVGRMMHKMMTMRKLDIASLEAAFEGEAA